MSKIFELKKNVCLLYNFLNTIPNISFREIVPFKRKFDIEKYKNIIHSCEKLNHTSALRENMEFYIKSNYCLCQNCV